MNRKQERKYSMYMAVITYLKTVDTAIIDKMPLMAESMENLQKIIDNIYAIAEDQLESRKGYRISKNITKEDVINEMYGLSGQVKSLAVNTNNTLLREKVSFTLSKLRTMADGILQFNAAVIYENALENIADLAPYGVTPATLAATQDLLTAFSEKLAQPRNAVTDKKIHTELLKLEFEKADELLDITMDTLVIIVRLTEKVFYKQYHNNRNIVGPFYSSLALRVFVFSQDLLPLKNVKAIINGDPTIYKTSVKGSFRIKSLPDGMHTITLSKAGYQTQVITFPITKGERTDLNITLLPL